MINISLNSENISFQRPIREHKGKKVSQLIDDYIVLDIETTGLDPYFDEIIEICALKISGDNIIDQYSTLIKPENPIDDFISELTGITNDMVENAPDIKCVLPIFLSFIGDSIIIGHNIHFDINFIYDKCVDHLKMYFGNDFLDTMRISRRLFPEISSHRLINLASEFNLVSKPTHRALSDCKCTHELYRYLKKYITDNNIDSSSILNPKKNRITSKDIISQKSSFDENQPLYGKICVITGKLDKMLRTEAMKIIADFGGINHDEGVTKDTDYLILGNNAYCHTIKDGKSTKQKKAEKYILEGVDLSIISENVFYYMINLD